MTGSTAGPPRLVLVGPPGAGKTSVGQVLAGRWDVALLDTDQVIEAGAADTRSPTSSSTRASRSSAASRRRRSPRPLPVTPASSRSAAARPLGGDPRRLAGLPVAFLDVGLAAGGRPDRARPHPPASARQRPRPAEGAAGRPPAALRRGRRPSRYARTSSTVDAGRRRGREAAAVTPRARPGSGWRRSRRTTSSSERASSARWCDARAGGTSGRGRPPGGRWPGRRRAVGQLLSGRLRGAPRSRCRTARPPRRPRWRASCWATLGAPRVHPLGRRGRCRWRCDHRSGRLRRGHVPAGHRGRPRADVAARHGGRGGRRQDRHQHRRGQEPGRQLPRAGGGRVRPGLLASLPPADLASGLAEVVKCGLIADPGILDLVARPSRRDATGPGLGDCCASWSSAPSPSRRAWSRRTCARRRQSGSDVGREALNYGHTLGHAIERVEGYAFRHGEAVSVGHGLRRRAGAAGRSARRRRSSTGTVDLLRLGGTADVVPAAGRWAELYDAMRLDKKSRGDRLRFVVLEGIGHPAILEAPGDERAGRGLRSPSAERRVAAG